MMSNSMMDRMGEGCNSSFGCYYNTKSEKNTLKSQIKKTKVGNKVR